MRLIQINKVGDPVEELKDLPEIARDVLKMNKTVYDTNGYQPPWICYLAVENDGCVGTCAFKSPPKDNKVEIAYFTFPENEGRGIATKMAQSLVDIAWREMPDIIVTAQTLPEENASVSILRKNGFQFIGEVEHPEDGTVWEWHLRKDSTVV